MNDLPQDTPLPSKRMCRGCGEEKDLTAKNFKPNRRIGFSYLCHVCIRKRDKEHALKRNQESPPVFDEHVLKKCTGPCNGSYPATLEYFHKANNKSGLTSQCKKCKAEYHLKHYYADIEVSRAKARAESKRNYPTKYKKHGKKIRARNRVYKATHKERCARAVTVAKQKKRQKYRDLHRAWEKAHPEKIRVWNLAHRTKRKSVAGTHTPAQIQEQLRRQHFKCYYAACGNSKFPRKKVNGKWKYDYHIEHTFPVSRVAGTDIPANDMGYIVLACPSCNHSKNNKFPWEWPEGGRLL